MTKLTDIVKNRVALATSSGKVSGTLALQDFTVTKGFGSFLHTGTGVDVPVVTGIPSVDWTVPANGSGFWYDRSTKEVKTDVGGVAPPGECLANISKIHLKSLSTNGDNIIIDGLRGKSKWIATNLTSVEATATRVTSFNNDGFTLSSDGFVNGNGTTYIVYQELYTHVKWGTTSGGELYIEVTNPITNKGIAYYIGNGLEGHTIPYSRSESVELATFKKLDGTGNWQVDAKYSGRFNMNLTLSAQEDVRVEYNDTSLTLPNSADWNQTGFEYIVYLSGASKNWTIVPYIGTGAAGNFVEVKDSEGNTRKPASIISKATSAASDWVQTNNKNNTFDTYTILNSSGSLGVHDHYDISDSGFTLNSSGQNALNVRYIALVEFDTNGDGGDSYFDLPTDDTNLVLSDAVVTYSDGVEPQGFKLSFASIVSESIDFSTAPDGFVYVYRDLAGAYGFDTVEPTFDTEIGYYSGETSAKSYIAKVRVASQTPQYVDYLWKVNKTYVHMLATTSMPTVNGSPILESGSNVNGSYVKYADGTLMCYFIDTTLIVLNANAYNTYFNDRGYVFPHPFSSKPEVANASVGLAGVVQTCASSGPPSLIKCTVRNACIVAGGTAYFGYIAVGRWK